MATGLVNMYTACYINSAFQVLLDTPKFANLYMTNSLRNFINVNNRDGGL